MRAPCGNGFCIMARPRNVSLIVVMMRLKENVLHLRQVRNGSRRGRRIPGRSTSRPSRVTRSVQTGAGTSFRPSSVDKNCQHFNQTFDRKDREDHIEQCFSTSGSRNLHLGHQNLIYRSMWIYVDLQIQFWPLKWVVTKR